MNNMEVWKDIKDYEGYYQVSNYGNIRSLDYNKTGKTKLMKPTSGKTSKYLQIGLNRFGKHKRFLVHHLVAIAFIPNYDNLPQVNHKDNNIFNNNSENLEWCTSSYNNMYGNRFYKEITTKNNKNASNCEKSVKCVETGIVYKSINEAMRATGVNQSDISKICRGKGRKSAKKAGGFHWEYVNNKN